MKEDIDHGYKTKCSTCLSHDRDLFDLALIPQLNKIFHLLMQDFTGNRLDILEVTDLICWECLAMFKKICKFKWKVHKAQEHLCSLTLNHAEEENNHLILAQSLSTLGVKTGVQSDIHVFDISTNKNSLLNSNTSTMAPKIKEEWLSPCNNTDLDANISEPKLVLKNVQKGPSRIALIKWKRTTPLEFNQASDKTPKSLSFNVIKPIDMKMVRTIRELNAGGDKLKYNGANKLETIREPKRGGDEPSSRYVKEYMTENEMLAARKEANEKIRYVKSSQKCTSCMLRFYTQKLMRKHIEFAHTAKPGFVPCKICRRYIEEPKLLTHTTQHYFRFTCKQCPHVEYSELSMQMHVKTHKEPGINNIKSENIPIASESQEPKVTLNINTEPIFECSECNMVFTNLGARKYHMNKVHSRRLQCDHCQGNFLNKRTLRKHIMLLHQAPAKRKECPLCHKMIAVSQIKYHYRRKHDNMRTYECKHCNKIYPSFIKYQIHFRYSKVHSPEKFSKYRCSICNKAYITNRAMQDHLNYQHLKKTTHKCPICEKPLANNISLKRHKARVHGEKKEKTRNYQCMTCGKCYPDIKILTQHEAIHSDARPFACDMCQQTFKLRAALYTHRKLVHKVAQVTKQIRYEEPQPVDTTEFAFVSVNETIAK